MHGTFIGNIYIPANLDFKTDKEELDWFGFLFPLNVLIQVQEVDQGSVLHAWLKPGNGKKITRSSIHTEVGRKYLDILLKSKMALLNTLHGLLTAGTKIVCFRMRATWIAHPFSGSVTKKHCIFPHHFPTRIKKERKEFPPICCKAATVTSLPDGNRQLPASYIKSGKCLCCVCVSFSKSHLLCSSGYSLSMTTWQDRSDSKIMLFRNLGICSFENQFKFEKEKYQNEDFFFN